MINLNNLSYRYPGGQQALYNVTAQITPGLHLLLGANGSGKTTLLHLIAGLRLAVPATACDIDGTPTANRQPSLAGEVFLLGDDMKFPYTSIRQMVKYHAPFYPNFDEELLQKNLRRFGLRDNEHIDRYSLGNRKKAQLAYVLSLRPRVLLLDEPANGLDITSRSEFLTMLYETMTDEQTVIVSTHTVYDFQNIVDNVIVLREGHLILSMPVWQITERLAFVSEAVPVADAIFMHQNCGRFNAIIPNDGSMSTDIDFVLFYGALQSTAAENLLSYLNTENQ